MSNKENLIPGPPIDFTDYLRDELLSDRTNEMMIQHAQELLEDHPTSETDENREHSLQNQLILSLETSRRHYYNNIGKIDSAFISNTVLLAKFVRCSLLEEAETRVRRKAKSLRKDESLRGAIIYLFEVCEWLEDNFRFHADKKGDGRYPRDLHSSLEEYREKLVEIKELGLHGSTLSGEGHPDPEQDTDKKKPTRLTLIQARLIYDTVTDKYRGEGGDFESYTDIAGILERNVSTDAEGVGDWRQGKTPVKGAKRALRRLGYEFSDVNEFWKALVRAIEDDKAI